MKRKEISKMATAISSSKFAEIIALARARKIQQESANVFTQVPASSDSQDIKSDSQDIKPESNLSLSEMRNLEILSHSTDKYGNSITYNSKQSDFVSLASSGKSCCLIGPAGTGKTTAMKGTVQALIQSSTCGILQNHDHKHLLHGVPGVVICAYTRRATNNIRRNMTDDMKANCITIHKLLEYGPEYFQILNENGEERTSMRFAPMRNLANPLPREITTIIFEESSMIGTSLYAEVLAALSHEVQIIFLGDIQQLPPVFGPAILGFKLTSLPTIELSEVYRQALESPIIRLAHRILSGQPIPPAELSSWHFHGQLRITPWKKQIDSDAALNVAEKLFEKLYSDGSYNPEEDIILIPFNKGFGTTELNKSIANHLALTKKRPVWEVISGFLKHYFSVGDKVLFDREDAIILDIYPNPSYTGVSPQPESTYLDYWGHSHSPTQITQTKEESTDVDIDFLLGQVAADDVDRVTQSSHHIKLLMQDSETEKTVTKAAEVNAMLLGYCLTVHKAQGSEWDKVFLLLHNSHATMMQRELLYTAVTRAKKELFVICEGDTFVKGIKSQRIKGNTLEEKAEYFKGRINDAQT
jgi:exodeoxyribonuclease V alpha subunit